MPLGMCCGFFKKSKRMLEFLAQENQGAGDAWEDKHCKVCIYFFSSNCTLIQYDGLIK